MFEKPPADVIGNAVKVMRIAIGEEAQELAADDGKDPLRKRWAIKAVKREPPA
jgi:hypothetical protein